MNGTEPLDLAAIRRRNSAGVHRHDLQALIARVEHLERQEPPTTLDCEAIARALHTYDLDVREIERPGLPLFHAHEIAHALLGEFTVHTRPEILDGDDTRRHSGARA